MPQVPLTDIHVHLAPALDDGPSEIDQAVVIAQPYRPELRDRAVWLYFAAGEVDLAQEQAEVLVRLLPKEVRAYAPLLEILAYKSEIAIRNRQPEHAHAHLERLFSLRNRLVDLTWRNEARKRPGRLPPPRLNLPPEIEFALGRAEFLRGRFQTAADHFQRAVRSGLDQAQPWQAAAEYLLGDTDRSQRRLDDLSEFDRQRFQDLLAIHGF